MMSAASEAAVKEILVRGRAMTMSTVLAWAVVALLGIAGPCLAQTPVLHERLPRDAWPPPDEPGDERDDGTGDTAARDDLKPDAADPGAPPTDPWGPPSSGFSVDAVPRLSPPGDVQLDVHTGSDAVLTYFAVFDPSVVPFKRGYVRDLVSPDGALTVGRPELRPVHTVGEHQRPGRVIFWGSLLVELIADRPVPIPTVAAGGRVLSVETSPKVPVELLQDGDENLFLRSPETARVRLNMLLDAPISYFGGELPPGPRLGVLSTDIADALPAPFRAAGRRVFLAIRTRLGRDPVSLNLIRSDQAIRDLVEHFRSFESGELPPIPSDPVARYEAVALGRKGVCRHRAYAFVVTARALGLRARFVANEAHAFVELRPPGAVGFRRIDLGGDAVGLDIRGGAHRSAHSPEAPDTFAEPTTYRASYSSQALARLSPQRAATTTTRAPLLPTLGRGLFAGLTRGRRGRDRRQRTTTTLDESVAYVFRGDPITVSGRLLAATPGDTAGLPVEIILVSHDDGGKIVRLGVLITDGDGAFAGTLYVTSTLPPDRYGLFARFAGDDELAPSSSR